MKRAVAAARARSGSRKGVGGHVVALLKLPLRDPVLSMALILAGGLSGYALVNAVVMQTGRHPAPLFASFSDQAPPPLTASVPATPMPPPAVAPAKRGAGGDINTLLSGRREPAAIPVPRPKQLPSVLGQSAGSGATIR